MSFGLANPGHVTDPPLPPYLQLNKANSLLKIDYTKLNSLPHPSRQRTWSTIYPLLLLSAGSYEPAESAPTCQPVPTETSPNIR